MFKARHESLGMSGDAFASLYGATPENRVLWSWTSKMDPTERVSNLAGHLLQPKTDKGSALVVSGDKEGVTIDSGSFGTVGGMDSLSDDHGLSWWIDSIEWRGVRPLTSGIAIAEGSISHCASWDDPVIANVTIPILATELVERSVSSGLFALYSAAVCHYLRRVMEGNERLRDYHRREVPVTGRGISTTYAYFTGESVKSRFEEVKDVPVARIMPIISDYAQNDSVARIHTHAKMRDSKAFATAIHKVGNQHFNHREPLDIVAIHENDRDRGPNWITLELHDLVASLTESERRVYLASPMQEMSESASQVFTTFRRMARDVAAEPNEVFDPYFAQLGVFWSTISSLVGTDLLWRAIPPNVGSNLRGMWMGGLAKNEIVQASSWSWV